MTAIPSRRAIIRGTPLNRGTAIIASVVQTGSRVRRVYAVFSKRLPKALIFQRKRDKNIAIFVFANIRTE